MEIDPIRFSCIVVNSGFQYSSEGVSNSIHRALERLCGSENIYQFQTQSGIQFCKQVLTTYNIFNDKGPPTKKDVTQLLSDPILRYTIQAQPDLLLVIHGANIDTEVIDCLKTACPNTRTAVWLVDEPMQVDLTEDYASHYDYVFTNERNTIKIHGKDRCWQLPLGFDDEVFDINKLDIEDEYKTDILISGSIYPERLNFIEELYEYIKHYDIKVIGKIIQRDREFRRESLKARYNGGIVPLRKMALYMSGAKICLDIPRRHDISEYGRTNARNIVATYLNPRIYETASVGSLILTSNSRESIGEMFDKDEYVTYSDVEECAEKIIYYLENEKERKAIAEKARKTVWKEHRYIDRARELIKCIPDKSLNTRIHGLNLSQEEQNSIAINKNKEAWQKNLTANEEFSDVGTLNEFKGCGKGRTAIIFSNGASSEKILSNELVMQRLRDAENIDIFTVNSAYKELRSEGVIPKFQVQIHPTDDQAKHFEGVDHDETIFLGSVLLDNKVLHAWRGEKRLFMPKGTLKMGLTIPPKYENKLALIESALVVGFSATAIACHFEYERIGFIGLDFSFIENKKYAYQKCDFDEEIRNGFIVKKDVNGAPIITTYVMLDACDYMIALTEGQKSVEFFNCTNSGLLFGDRIQQIEFIDFINSSNGR